MPGFEALYKQTVTVFNRKIVGEKTYWYPVIIPNVHLIVDRSIIISTYGEQAQDNAKLHIRYTPNGNGAIVAVSGGTRSYMQPKVFRASGVQGMNITFAFGDDFDFILSGEYSEEILRATASSENFSVSINSVDWKKSVLAETGNYIFTYNGSVWTYGGVEVSLASYGLTVSGTVVGNDKIVVKYVSADGPIDDDDYPKGFFNHMNKAYDDVFAITNVAKFNLIPHFEIVAR